MVIAFLATVSVVLGFQWKGYCTGYRESEALFYDSVAFFPSLVMAVYLGLLFWKNLFKK